MSDYRDGNGDHRRAGQGSPPGSARPRSEDPLAELARLIDEDPFADFDRSAPARAGAADFDRPPASPPEGGWTIDTSWAQDRQPPGDGTVRRGDEARFDAAQPRAGAEPEYAAFSPRRDAAIADGEAERFEQSLVDHFRELDARDHQGLEAQTSADLDRQRTDEVAPVVPESQAEAAVEPPQAAPAANASPQSFDPVSAVAAHLFADQPQHDNRTAEAAHTTPAQGARINPFAIRRPEAHDIVRPPVAGDDPAAPAGDRWAQDASAHHGDDGGLPEASGQWPDEAHRDFGHAEPYYDEAYAEAGSRPYHADEQLPPEAVDQRGYYGADVDIPPPPPEAMERRPRRGLVVVSSLVGLVVLGGAVALGYRGLSSDPAGEPPVIRADTAPTKVAVEPDEPAAEEGQGKLVYERIGGTETERQERLVSREEPVFEVAGRNDATGGGEPTESSNGERGAEDVISPATGRSEPRRVRTVVVRPDGTIIPPASPARSEETAAEPEDARQGGQTAQADADDEVRPDMRETVALAAPVEPEFEPPSPPQLQPEPPQAEQAADADGSGQAEVPAEPQAEPAQPQPAGEQRTGRPLQLVPGAGSEAPAAEQTQTAAVPSAPQEPETRAAGQPFPAGSYVVQVSSTRSENEARAAAASLAQRHGGLLGDYRMGVERADLGDRGVFYRVAAGAMTSQSDAIALCEQLKANGQDCFVRRN